MSLQKLDSDLFYPESYFEDKRYYEYDAVDEIDAEDNYESSYMEEEDESIFESLSRKMLLKRLCRETQILGMIAGFFDTIYIAKFRCCSRYFKDVAGQTILWNLNLFENRPSFEM